MNRAGKAYLYVLVGYCLIRSLTGCAPIGCPAGYENLIIEGKGVCVKGVSP